MESSEEKSESQADFDRSANPGYALGQKAAAFAKAERDSDPADAEPFLIAAAKLAPNVAQYQIDLGLFYGQQKRFSDAEPYVREAVRLNPTNPGIQEMLGPLLFAQQKASEAEPFLREAVRLADKQPQFHINLASVLLTEGKKDKAKLEAQKAKDLGLKDNPIYGPLGITG